jgi:gamma-glutamyltranspeptidase/glutathione hydrolase
MVEAERAHKAEGRSAGIVAARDRFYKGDIANEMVGFLKRHDAPSNSPISPSSTPASHPRP